MARAPAKAEIEELPEADRLEGFPHPARDERALRPRDAERELARGLRRRPHAPRLAARRAARASARRRWPTASRAPCSRAGGARSRRDKVSPSRDTTSAARQVRALSHPGLLVLRRPYDVQGQALRHQHPGRRGAPAAIVPRRIAAGRTAGASSSSSSRRAQRQRRQRAAEVAGGAADAHGVPARLLGTRDGCCRPSARAAARSPWRRSTPRRCARPPRRRSPAAERAAPPSRNGRCSSGSRRAAPGACSASLGRRHRALRGTRPKSCSLLPKVDWRAVHALADELQPIAATARFELFFELLLDVLVAPDPRRRQRARGRRGPELAARRHRGGAACLVCRPVGKNSPRKGRYRLRSTSIARA